MPEIVWTPSEDCWQDSALARFARESGFDPRDYAGLHRWSISDLSGFWSKVWDFVGVIGDKGERVFVPNDDAWMTGARFFPDARINLAENFLRQTGDEVVIVEADETGHRAHVTADELRAFIERFERLEAEKKDIADQQKEVMAEAKGRGYDTKVIRKLITLRRREPDDIAEEEVVLEMYKEALGMR